MAKIQEIRAEELYEMAALAQASGSLEAYETFKALGARSTAIALAANLAIHQVRAMMLIAETIFDMGI